MSNATVRPYEDRDREGYFNVRAVTYNDGAPIPPENQVFKTTRPFVGEIDGRVEGVFNVLDLTCTRGPALLKCGGIAGVAVLPERRQTGIGSVMMAEAVRQFRADSIPMASLYAFRESYYRKFGYETCGRRYEISCPNGRYPKVQAQLEVTRIDVADTARIQACLAAFSHARSGGCIRNEIHWGRVLDERKNVYVAGDPAEAYAIVQHSTEFWKPQFVNEFAWSTRAGYESILATLSGIGINKSALEWYEPSDSPFLQRFTDYGVTAKLSRPIMYRVTDVPSALALLKPELSGSFTVEILDEVVPENQGPWRVTFSPGIVSVEPCATGGLKMPIQQFTQAFLGEPSLTDLARSGAIEVRSPEALLEATNLLTPTPVYCMEFF
jgi:predicted acetyltransferase